MEQSKLARLGLWRESAGGAQPGLAGVRSRPHVHACAVNARGRAFVPELFCSFLKKEHRSREQRRWSSRREAGDAGRRQGLGADDGREGGGRREPIPGGGGRIRRGKVLAAANLPVSGTRRGRAEGLRGGAANEAWRGAELDGSSRGTPVCWVTGTARKRPATKLGAASMALLL